MMDALVFDLARLQSLLSHLEEGVVICDGEDRILHANFAAALILYVSLEDLLGKPFRNFCALKNGRAMEDEAPTPLPKVTKAVVTRRNGEEQEIHIRISPIDEQGQLRAYILTPVGMLSSSLANDREKLKVIQASRMRALGELATGMAHELSQPLSIISLQVGLAQRRLAQAADPYVEEKLNLVLRQVQRASDVIQHMRQFIRGSQSASDPVPVNEAVQSSLTLLRHRLNRASIDIRLELAPDLPRVHARYADLEQIIVQCVLNAFEALEEDSKKNKFIHVRTERLAEEVRISVEDNGGGMPDFILQHIFTPFFSSKRNGEGMGIGLAVCQLLADDMNARMTVSTALGAGTVVRLHIPFTQCDDEKK